MPIHNEQQFMVQKICADYAHLQEDAEQAQEKYAPEILALSEKLMQG